MEFADGPKPFRQSLVSRLQHSGFLEQMQELQQNQLATDDVEAVTKGERTATGMRILKDLPY